jgi:hypothetical protein
LSLQLLSLGAPLGLVSGAHHAALDEIRHAEICFARARRHADEDFRPGALDVAGCLDDVEPCEHGERQVVEGCIGETLAAAVMSEQAERARDAGLRRELSDIALDESQHAALAFRIARWTIARGGSKVLGVVRDAFASYCAPALDEANEPTALSLEMATLGHLDARSYARACRSTYSEVVLPLALELEHEKAGGRVALLRV